MACFFLPIFSTLRYAAMSFCSSRRRWSALETETLLESNKQRWGCWGTTRGKIRGGCMVLYYSTEINLRRNTAYWGSRQRNT